MSNPVNQKSNAGEHINKFIYACAEGDLDLVRQLVEEGGLAPNTLSTKLKVSGIGMAAYGSREGCPAVLEYLIAKGGDVNLNCSWAEGVPVIVSASFGARPESSHKCLEILIKAGANLEAVDGDGSTALIKAAKRGQTQSVKTLVQAGANPFATDKKGLTASVWASQKLAKETVSDMRNHYACIFGFLLNEEERQLAKAHDAALAEAAERNAAREREYARIKGFLKPEAPFKFRRGW